MNFPRSFVVIPAAGIGSRAKAALPKQYITIRGKAILQHSIDRFLHLPWIEKIVVAIHPTDVYFEKHISSHPKIITLMGGDERAHSVLNALNGLQPFADGHDWVYVHDAVRPCIHPADIENLRSTLANHPVGGILAQPMQDTLKEVVAETVTKTLDRTLIWRALTPQVFRYQLLLAALIKQQAMPVTDDCGFIEHLGYQPKIIRALHDNPKLTYPEDLRYMAHLLQQFEEEFACA